MSRNVTDSVTSHRLCHVTVISPQQVSRKEAVAAFESLVPPPRDNSRGQDIAECLREEGMGREGEECLGQFQSGHILRKNAQEHIMLSNTLVSWQTTAAFRGHKRLYSSFLIEPCDCACSSAKYGVQLRSSSFVRLTTRQQKRDLGRGSRSCIRCWNRCRICDAWPCSCESRSGSASAHASGKCM
jgi:hypothetical protein